MGAGTPAVSQTDPFQILALDGGGIKGIFSAAVLAAIEDDIGTRIADHFDLIAGTSTGGIIAVGLGLGLTPRQILEFYLQQGKAIFRNRLGLRSPLRVFARKYSASPLEAALKQCFGERLFGDSKKRLIIPAYNLGEDDVYNFRTAHHERLKRDFKVPAWKVALSTSAAPTYFPSCRKVDSIRLIDGGVWANNPSMVAIVEAFGTLDVHLSRVRVLNLGTCDEVTDRKTSLDGGGFFQWRKAAFDVFLRGQSIAAANQARFLIGTDNFMRLSPVVPSEVLTLDGTSKIDDLIAKAAHYSRSAMPGIKRVFCNHEAKEFLPFHTHEQKCSTANIG